MYTVNYQLERRYIPTHLGSSKAFKWSYFKGITKKYGTCIDEVAGPKLIIHHT